MDSFDDDREMTELEKQIAARAAAALDLPYSVGVRLFDYAKPNVGFHLAIDTPREFAYSELRALADEFQTTNISVGADVIETGGCSTCAGTEGVVVLTLQDWT